MTKLLTPPQVNELIDRGEILFIAGSSEAIWQLKPGNWIAGSTSYFMGSEKGLVSDQLLHVCQIPAPKNFRIQSYSVEELPRIPAHYFGNGYSLILIPGMSQAHLEFAKNVFNFPDLFAGNLVGWITGNRLEAPADQAPFVMDGRTLERFDNSAILLHVDLPNELIAKTEIVNIFEPTSTYQVEFPETSFRIESCRINGEVVNFADFLRANKIDTRLPLIADFSGAHINVSFNQLAERHVDLYAPVFRGVKYHFAKPVPDYAAAFAEHTRQVSRDPVFSCNCILNYVYAELEGKKVGPVAPMTFGEVAYILLNQTLVNLVVEPRQTG
ncbi:MAG TPA: hypothetical protein PLZ57_13440 [Pseudobdellovibrionaceae bacterium]|nr:hypothetical protein [Pseudobdellovibrionaceae bacterium]